MISSRPSEGDSVAKVLAAAEQFRQGHLIKKPPFFYEANLDYPLWDFSHARAEERSPADPVNDLIDLGPEQAAPYGLITTQTCDIHRVEQQPWIQVAPVYSVNHDDPKAKSGYAVELNPPDLPDNGLWIADLRIEVPLEKGRLVNCMPYEAFSAEEDYEELGEILARRRGRPALHNVFNELLSTVFQDMKKKSGLKRLAKEVRESRVKLRLAIEDGTRRNPVAAKLYVVTTNPPDDHVLKWFEEWWNRAEEVASSYGLTLQPVGWLDRHSVDLDLYDTLIPIQNPI